MMLKSYQLTDRRDLESEKERLEQQARILFQFEASVFQAAFAGRGRHLLDFGCGNGTFTSLVAGQFAQVTGVDINDELLASARGHYSDINFQSIRELAPPALEMSLARVGPSAILMRFVVQHLNPSEWSVLKLVAEYCVSHSVRLVIVDVDDSELAMHPANKAIAGYFDRLTAYIAQQGGCRLLNAKIRDSFSEWTLPILRRDRVEVVFTESNVAAFRAVCAPGLIRSNPQISPQEVEDSFETYFANGGGLYVPLFYHVF